jgi:hypothetical protein
MFKNPSIPLLFGAMTAIAVALSIARPAQAQQRHERPQDQSHIVRAQTAEHEPPSEWYGWQNLALDGSSLLLLALAADSSNHDWSSKEISAGFGITGGLLFSLGAPTVHWSRGHVGRGMRSLALRLLASVLAGAASGIDITDPYLRGRWQPPGPLVFAIPAGITIVLDGFAHDRSPRPTP